MSVGLKQLRQDGASDGDAVKYNGTSGEWEAGAISGSAARISEQYLLTENNNNPYLKIQSGDWTVHGTLRYRGSAVVGAPVAMKAILWMNGTNGTTECRVYDLTNSNVVATGGSVVDQPNPTVVSLGTVQNIPTGEAIFEIQAKRTGNEGRISWFCLDY